MKIHNKTTNAMPKKWNRPPRRNGVQSFPCSLLMKVTDNQFKAIGEAAKKQEIPKREWARRAFDAYLNTNPQHQ
jgi:hypothetical protein